MVSLSFRKLPELEVFDASAAGVPAAVGGGWLLLVPGIPPTAEEAIPHALPTERMRANEKLGVFWEAYNTDPNGEKMGISLTVVREIPDNPTFLRRSLRIGRENTPVSVSVQDLSAIGKTLSARAIELDISTLPKGAYIVQLEVSVAGQYVIRTDHRIEIISP